MGYISGIIEYDKVNRTCRQIKYIIHEVPFQYIFEIGDKIDF